VKPVDEVWIFGGSVAGVGVGEEAGEGCCVVAPRAVRECEVLGGWWVRWEGKELGMWR
jgi:hypothetical protein